VTVHKELPDELCTEAIRSTQVASQLFAKAQGLLSGMCCPPGGDIIQEAPEPREEEKAQDGQ
jgi:hypothetical protein